MENVTWNSYVCRQKGSPMNIHIAQYPQLRDLCWNRPADTVLDGEDALALYERNWRFIDADRLTQEEQALLDLLVARYGNGVLNV